MFRDLEFLLLHFLSFCLHLLQYELLAYASTFVVDWCSIYCYRYPFWRVLLLVVVSMSSPSQDFCSRSPYSSVFRFVHPPLVLLVSFCVKFSHSRLFEWIVLYLILFQSLVAWFFVFLLRIVPSKGRGSKTPIKGSSSRTPNGARDENLPTNPPV